MKAILDFRFWISDSRFESLSFEIHAFSPRTLANLKFKI